MTQPLVSVIVPTYNGAKRIARTLQSLIEQDYENLEIIVVDDVSTDNTVDVAQKVLEDSGRNFQLIKRSVNGRQSAARNTGFRASRGEYVIFFDHDDFAEKNFVSRLVSEAEGRGADFAFCRFKYYFEGDDLTDDVKFSLHEKIFSGEDCLKLWIAKKINFRGPWNCLFKKKFLDEHHLRFTESCIWGEDEEFLIKSMVAASKVCYVEDTFYIYVHYAGQTNAQYSIGMKKILAYKNLMLANFRTGRYMGRHAASEWLRSYGKNFLPADTIIKTLTICAEVGRFETYERMSRTLRHARVKKLFWSTARFIFHKPELFFKALAVMYLPNFYYKARAKKSK